MSPVGAIWDILTLKNIHTLFKCLFRLPWRSSDLRLQASNAGGLGLLPGQGTRSHRSQLRIPHAALKIKVSHN